MALRAKLVPSVDSVEILMGEVTEEAHPFTGHRMLKRKDVRRPERMREYMTFEETEGARVPAAYYVPGEISAVVRLLAAHGIRTETMTESVSLTLERFTVDSSRQSTTEFQGHHERVVFGQWARSTATLPAGTIVVPMKQPLAKLVFALLEPRSDDGIVNWNLVDELMAKGSYPVLRGLKPDT